MSRFGRFRDHIGRSFAAEVQEQTVRVLSGAPWLGGDATGEVLDLAELRLLPPVVPGKIVCVGLNYRDHITEFGHEVPEEPVLFLKPPTAVVGHGEPIIYPEGVTQLDFEAELAVVIGSPVRNADPKDALNRIFGYSCANDVTARDLQRKDGQWTRAKSFDTFCPIGPYIVNDVDPCDLSIESRLNGEIRQRSTTGRMLFGPAFLVAFVSRIMTLNPGDVILTGTPSGVGPMNIGDSIQVEIEGVGSLVNTVAGASQGPNIY